MQTQALGRAFPPGRAQQAPKSPAGPRYDKINYPQSYPQLSLATRAGSVDPHLPQIMVARLRMSTVVASLLESGMTVSCLRLLAAVIACAGMVSACSVPKGSANARQILAGAEDADADFAVFPVARDTVGSIADWPGSSKGALASSGWIDRNRGPASNLIAVGDRIDVTVWETGEGTLLTMPGQQVVALPGLTVSPDGTVFLPYVDKVYVAQMTPDQARETIQQKMAPFVPAAQVFWHINLGGSRPLT